METKFEKLFSSLAGMAGGPIASSIVKKFLDETQIVPKVRTWNLKNDTLILKLHLKTDRAPMAISDIFLELSDSTFIYPSETDYVKRSQEMGNVALLLYDASSQDLSLNKFIPYTGGSLDLDFEETTEISIVFPHIETSINFYNLKLMFEYNNKFIAFNLGELLEEVPNMLLYFKQRNKDIEAYVKSLQDILGLNP